MRPLFLLVSVIAVASMFTGNLLALFQTNVKRLLAYSSIAHFGYLLVAFLTAGPLRLVAVMFYLAQYFVTTLGAFGVVTVMSTGSADADSIDDYYGLYGRRPWIAIAFTLMLLSLAGVPLTAGFIGKFLVMTAGMGASLIFLVVMLAINSAIGLFYYLRVIAVLFGPSRAVEEAGRFRPARASYAVIIVLVALVIWWGIFPGRLISMIIS